MDPSVDRQRSTFPKALGWAVLVGTWAAPRPSMMAKVDFGGGAVDDRRAEDGIHGRNVRSGDESRIRGICRAWCGGQRMVVLERLRKSGGRKKGGWRLEDSHRAGCCQIPMTSLI